jgi:hypothetical protein
MIVFFFLPGLDPRYGLPASSAALLLSQESGPESAAASRPWLVAKSAIICVRLDDGLPSTLGDVSISFHGKKRICATDDPLTATLDPPSYGVFSSHTIEAFLSRLHTARITHQDVRVLSSDLTLSSIHGVSFLNDSSGWKEKKIDADTKTMRVLQPCCPDRPKCGMLDNVILLSLSIHA